MSITTVISYCTNDFRFLGKCIEEASHFSKQIIVPVCDHFFHGAPENRDLLQASYAAYPTVQFLEFPYSNELYPSHLRLCPEDKEWTAHWNSLARLLGFYTADTEWILFLDTDEIVEGQRFREAFESGAFNAYDAIRLACYYYVLKPYYRANKVQDLSLLVRKNALQPRFFYQRDERYGMYAQVTEKKEMGLRGLDRRPLVHHYSWVRPEEECMQKVNSWSHRLDKNWQEIVQELFRGKGLEALFGKEIAFEEIADVYFDPLSVRAAARTEQREFGNVRKLTARDFLRLELEWEGLL